MKPARALLLFALLTCFSHAAQAAKEKYVFDSNKTVIEWRVKSSDITGILAGKFPAVAGSVNIDRDKPESSEVFASLKIETLASDTAGLADGIKKFFDIAHYPSAGFVSTGVKVTGPHSADVQGIFVINGVSKPATLSVTLDKDAASAPGSTITFTATTSLLRSDFSLGAHAGDMQDAVTLTITCIAIKI